MVSSAAPAPQPAVEAAPILPHFGIDFMWKSPVSECGFVILDCCFILGVEVNSVTEGGGLRWGRRRIAIYRTDNRFHLLDSL